MKQERLKAKYLIVRVKIYPDQSDRELITLLQLPFSFSFFFFFFFELLGFLNT